MPSQGLLNDILFKIVFGVQDSEPTLLPLLNALLGYTGEQRIASLTITNPTFGKEYATSKEIVLDLRAVDGTGRWFNIEVQLEPGGPEDYHVKRSVYYLAKLYADQLEQGQSYAKLAKTVHISLLDFNLFKERGQAERLHSVFHLKEAQEGFLLSDIIELHYIELRKFSISELDNLRNSFEKWLYALKVSPNYLDPKGEPLPDILKEEEGIQMAIESMQKAYARDEIRELIKDREKARRDYLSGLDEAARQGEARGEARGEVKGRVEVARQMLIRGTDPTFICQVTGLSAEELAALSHEMKSSS